MLLGKPFLTGVSMTADANDPTAIIRNLVTDPTELRARAEKQVETMLSVQQKVLSELESLLLGWFDRRHTGAEAIADATQTIFRSTDVAEAVRAYNHFLVGATNRMMTEALEAQAHGARIAKALASVLQPPAIEPPEATTSSPGTVQPPAAADERRAA